MDYFKILNLEKEPFSNSPDPAFFFQSEQHQGCLQKLELSLRTRRGLNVVIGEVGTGKTTLCRQLILKFAEDDGVDTHLILDPDFDSTREFLFTVYEMCLGSRPAPDMGEWQIKERIKTHIFHQGVDREKITVLLLDEGQKASPFCLEVLREFLNYETNAFKLLQIVIFAQKEFEQTLAAHANFADRINLFHRLEPLNFRDTRRMIQFRLQRSTAGHRVQGPMFSLSALWAVYRATGGYPRKIINLCHQTVLTMIIQNRRRADGRLVRSCVRRALANPPRIRKGRIAAAAALSALSAVAAAGLYLQKTQPAAVTPIPIAPGKTYESRIQVLQLPEVETALATVAPPAAEAGVPARPEPDMTAIEAPASRPPEASAGPAAADRDPVGLPPSPSVALTSVDEAPAAPEPKPRAVRQGDVGVLPLPSVLGSLILQPGDTLSWLCIKVYGAYNQQVRNAVVSANPDIEDPNNLRVGQFILFPGEPVAIGQGAVATWWVKLSENETLGEALDVVRAYTARGVPVRIISHWNAVRGMGFTVVLWRHFQDEDAALAHLAKLPGNRPPSAAAMARWAEDTVFFSDPFLGAGA